MVRLAYGERGHQRRSITLVADGETLHTPVGDITVLPDHHARPRRHSPLVWATHLHLIQLWETYPNFSECSALPVPIDLGAWFTAIIKHGQENRTHGSNCVCMDQFMRAAKAHLARVIPSEDPDERDARYRLHHVLLAIARSL